MSSNLDFSCSPSEFAYSVNYVKQGFAKLAAQSWNQENEVLYQSSRGYAETPFEKWTPDLFNKALIYLSKHILNPRHSAKILFIFEQCILKILRFALASEADHRTKCSTLRIILKFKPFILQHCISYFDGKCAPWEGSDDESKLPKKMKLAKSDISDLEIAECCWILLKANLNYFKSKWNWCDFVNKFIPHKDLEVVWFACQCAALVLGMNEAAKLSLIEKCMPIEKHYDFSIENEVEKQSSHSIALETLNFDANPARVFMPLYQQNVSNLTVCVAGVNLDVKDHTVQVKEGCLVETSTTQANLRRIAVAIQTGKAACLVGPVGSGKTSLITHLALITGRDLSKGLLKIQLGEETDSKLLLGSYQCTDVPGEFVWSPGMLTKAVIEGRWLLLEDIGSASGDVAALLVNLLEAGSITIPGFKDSVRPAPGFHLFMTHRLISNFSVHHRRDAFNTELLEKHWIRINLEPLPQEELVEIIQTKFPLLKTIAAQMTSAFLLFSQGNHSDEDCDLAPIHAGSRLISSRDLFKWCRRAVIEFDVSSVESALKVLQDAIDIFCCSYSSDEKRLELAGEVAAKLGIIKLKAEYFCSLYKPNINLTPTTCIAGRASLPRIDFSSVPSLKNLFEGLRFAVTRGSACLLERVAACLQLDEPALLVGETGTGKTTTLQLLARQTGHRLVVINMNQQSDSSDLLGGYKPIDTKQVIMPLRDDFEALFRSLFNVEKNLKFLENISICISNRRWLTLLKLMLTSQKAALNRLDSVKDSQSYNRWLKLGEKMYKLQTQLKQNEAAMAFSFVEGSLIQAMKAGHWVLLDEINLASAETLQCLSGLLEGSSIHLLERGDDTGIVKHQDFRIMAAMNPATDFGKKDLPPGIRNRFTEIFVSEHTEKGDLALVVNCYVPDLPSAKVDAIVDFYLRVRKCAVEILSDGSGSRPHYSLRTLCRALVIASENRCGSSVRSLYEGLSLSFLTQLNPASHEIVRSMIAKAVSDKGNIRSILSQPIQEPEGKHEYLCFEGYWVSKGSHKSEASKSYILTESVKRNLCDLSRVVSLSTHPVLIQGGTSVGKTSLVLHLAEASGHRALRINNHQHTDLQEYIGAYCADSQTGALVFKEGVLAQAMRRGDWIILDELNLAPSEVLEALNRVLDDNRELFIPETSVTIKAHPDFRIFATQNPPGTYGGRKMLSRAFRNRFVELHFGEIPNEELQEILHQRCHMPRSYCKKLVNVMADLQRRRRGSATFAGKEGYITLRDLFRWGERYRLASSIDQSTFYDWDQHVADEGFLVLAGRVRKKEEQDIIQSVIQKQFKRTVDLDKLFTLNDSTSPVTKHILEKIILPSLPDGFKHLVWTLNLRKLAVLVGKALDFQEPILLVGETGCGKTTICQLLAAIKSQLLYSVNCHQHSESSDFLGGLRPVREMSEKSGKLFEWVDGPLIQAMKEGHLFLVDEISLADDSVLERLNSLLEPERKLLVSEKGSGDDIEIVARDEFHFIGTMNPGGDFGKKELSPALRNRLTEIWCEGPQSEEDLSAIIDHNIHPSISALNKSSSSIGKTIVEFVSWFSSTEFGKRISVSVRNLLVWVNFINATVGRSELGLGDAYLHGACLTVLDGIGSANTATDNLASLSSFRRSCIDFILKQLEFLGTSCNSNLHITSSSLINENDKFGIHPFLIRKGVSGKVENFMFEAPTTCLNLLRLLRALQVSSRAVLLEGSPGVGKTSLVLALAQATDNKVTRINLSEQTDVSDLFGTDLPVEGAAGGTFAWSDGPFLRALKEGHWILLDELNLASQSVIEGLNSVLDHRGEIFIPDLGKTFKVKPEETKLFACQNPQRQGGARKGLPQSFLNRFTQVFVEPLSDTDLEVIANGLFPDVQSELLTKMVQFHKRVSRASWSSPGLWEFNLRDLMRWGESLRSVVPGAAVATLYAARMPAKSDRDKILEIYKEILETSYPLASSSSPVLVSPSKVTVGEVSLPRHQEHVPFETYTTSKEPLLLLRSQQPALKSLLLAVKMGWMAILIGKSGSGKTSLVHVLAQLVGKKLHTIPVSTAMDTTDLLGGFEQTDLWRHLERTARDAELLLTEEAGRLLVAGESGAAAGLLDLLHGYHQAASLASHKGYDLKASEANFRSASERLSRLLRALPASGERSGLEGRLTRLDSLLTASGLQAGGVFEWIDSLLIKCVEEGEWLLLENVNLCSGAVLDRLNSLLEKDGSLALGERGEAHHLIRPHPDFRIFLTMDPQRGSISRAMRNRGVEIYLDVPQADSIHPFDLDSLLFNCGLILESHRSSLREIHSSIVDKNIGPEAPGLHHLLEVAYIGCQNWRQGFSLYDSIEKAASDVYIKSRSLSSQQRKSLRVALKEILVEHRTCLTQSEFNTHDCFWSLYKTPSTLSIQDESHLAIACQHSSIIYSILRNFERAKFSPNWPKDFTLKSIIGSEIMSYPQSNSSKYLNLIDDIPSVITYLLISYYSCATSIDILVRKKWLDRTVSHIIRNHPYPDSLMNMFDGILHISNIIFETLYPLKIFKERPWDIRHITNVNEPSLCNNFFSRENKIFTHIVFKILSANQVEQEREPRKAKWKLMSAMEYSKAVEIGNVDKWPYREPLVLELHPLLSTFDEIIVSALSAGEEVLLPNGKCAQLIYQLAWRFKLSTVARRRLFKMEQRGGAGAGVGAPPAVSEETIATLKLHYSWFKKHAVSALMDLTQGSSSLSVKVHDFLEILNSIDSSLDDGSVAMLPVARKFRKLHLVPAPKSTTLQCDLAKKIVSLESDIDVWRSSSMQVSKINFLASGAGEEARLKLTTACLQLLEKKDLDSLNCQIAALESSVKKVFEADYEACNLNDLIRLKIWPILEVIGVKLSTAVRRMIPSGRTFDPEQEGLVVDGFLAWCESSGSLAPTSCAVLQSGLRGGRPPAGSHLPPRPDSQLLTALSHHLLSSPPLLCPLSLIHWEETQAGNPEEGFNFLDEKGVYAVHMPLVSLFLSELLAGFSSQRDTPSFALKSHKNLTKMFHLLKLILWRNLPAIFSKDLCNRSNEIMSIQYTYTNVLLLLKKAFNHKKKNAITGQELPDISRELLAILGKMTEGRGGVERREGSRRLQLPETGLRGGLAALERLAGENGGLLEAAGVDSGCEAGSARVWLAIGEAWAHLGRIHLLLFSLLQPVDPVKKQALKKQYVSEEISELRVLLCVEELNKLLIGAAPLWPLKEEHEKRISLLERKYSDKNQETAIRPSVSLYNNILLDVMYLTTVLVPDETFTSRLSSLTSFKVDNRNRDEMELHLSEVKSWMTSLTGITENLYAKYHTEYPDIISPILMAMSQLNYGLKLVWTSAQKELHMLGSRHFKTSLTDHLILLSSFPISDLGSAVKLLECCSSHEIISLLNKSKDTTSNFQEQENKIKLIKICIKIIKAISQSHVMKDTTNTFFQVLDHVVLCWHQIQEQEKIKKAQEDSIYINRMKLTEEELLEREKRELFPTSREEDFHDIDAPDTLEEYGAPPPAGEKSAADPLRLSTEEIAEVCELHGQIVREAVRAHWLAPVESTSFSHLHLLKDRMEVFSSLVRVHYPGVEGERVDGASLPALLLVAGLPSVLQVEGETASVTERPYDFYRDSNLPESKTCIPLLNAILKRVKELLTEWPDHPTLNQAVVIMERVLGFSMGSPLSRFLTGLELLLTKLHHWEENAHAGVSLASHQASLCQQIIRWRQLELSAWKGALASASRRIESNCRKYWFHIYSLVTAYTRCEGQGAAEDTEELVKSLEAFMESSSLGEFSLRLKLLHLFHCHTLLLSQSHRRDIASSVLWNLYNFYKLFSSSVSKTIDDLTSVVRDKVKKFVKLARWNDINYWSVKAAVEKTHHTLLKHIKEYEKILNEPAKGAMTKMEIPRSLTKLNLSQLKISNYLTTNTLPESYHNLDSSSDECLLYRLSSLLKKSKSLSTKIYQNCSYGKLLDDFEILIDDIEETGKLLNELDIDPAIPKEKKKSAFKALLQKKRKAMSDLFKLLNQAGLSYRYGLMLFEQKNISFAMIPPFDIEVGLDAMDKWKGDKDWLGSWKGAENYFHTTTAKLAMLKIALEKPHQDLGPQVTERIKGFASHSNSLLFNLKETLGSTAVLVCTVRCQIFQIMKLNISDTGIINPHFHSNKNKLKDTFENVIFCLKQFIVLLDACPEQDVKLSENQPITIIFPDLNKQSMVMSFKHDPTWESVRAKVEAIIDSSTLKLKQILTHEKHSSYARSVNPSQEISADVIINEKYYQIVESGYEHLRKIYLDICAVEKYFEQEVNGKKLSNPLTVSLSNLKSNIDSALDFHKTVDYPTDSSFDAIDQMIASLSAPNKDKFEKFLNKILCIIQNVYKNHASSEIQADNEKSEKNPEEYEVPEQTDIIIDGHLKEKIIERLMADLNVLRMGEVSEDLRDILSEISSLDNESEKRICQSLLLHIYPILDQLVKIYHYFMVHITGGVKTLGKFSAYLMSVFIDFSKSGYRIPEEMLEEEEEGSSVRQSGGLGLGEGEGEKDVSEQIESEDQLEDARRPADYGQDEDKDCKEEEKGIEMSENFDGKQQDIEKKDDDEEGSGDESDKEELDKEMGETEKGADQLDKQIWGSDSEEEAEEESEEPPKETEGERGEQQTEKQLGAGDEEKAEVPEKEEKGKKQPKEKDINEMDNQEVDDDQIDPYHGKQMPSPEVEPLELEDEDVNLDEGEDKMSEGEDEENPFDIDTMKKSMDEKGVDEPEELEEKEGEKKDEEEEGSGEGGEEEDQPKPDVRGPEKEEEETNQEEMEEGEKDDEGTEEGDQTEDTEELGQAESEGADEQPTQQNAEKSDRPHGSKDQVKNNDEERGDEGENAPEETKAEGKEQSGSGQAERMDTETGGHRGEFGKRKNQGMKEREEKQQRPGQSEMERSLGEANEPVKKKLKTMSVGKEREEDEEGRADEKMEEEEGEAELYQHIREAKESQHDTQAVDAATKEQAEKQPPVIGKEEEEKDELKEDEEINVLDEDEPEIDPECPAQKERSRLEESEARPDSPSKQKGEGGGPADEAKVEVEGELVETAWVARGSESSFHTRLEEAAAGQEYISEEQLQVLRSQLEEQLASWTQCPESEEASAAWEKVCSLTGSLAQQLSEELRLVLEPTTASSLRGDFRTGKRINMRKVIPYIASQFRKDKIWLRRTKPSKREYQIILAIDDSSSMADNHSKELAFESLAVVSKALNLIEAGELAVISFGEQVRVLHQLGQPFTESTGARLMQEFRFDERRTRVGAAVETATGLVSMRGPDSAQLLVIVSDGRCVMSEGEPALRSAVRRASHARLFIVFIILDSPNSKDSVLDIRMATFNAAKKLEMKSYIDNFPFPFYLILREISNLPTVLSDALRQWFELVTDLQ